MWREPSSERNYVQLGGQQVFGERGDVWDHGTTRFICEEGAAGHFGGEDSADMRDPWTHHVPKRTPATVLCPQN